MKKKIQSIIGENFVVVDDLLLTNKSDVAHEMKGYKTKIK